MQVSGMGLLIEGDMQKKCQSGFTLVEMAVVVFLIGILATIGLSALNAQLASASISNTKKKQDVIKDALISYLGTNKRLPCPATDISGLESRVIANAPANCTGQFGLLPYAELNLPKSAALDGWDDFFSYAVSGQWTLSYSPAPDVVGGKLTHVASNAFNTGIAGALILRDRVPATNATPTSIGNFAVLIVSHGKNGLGSFTSKGTVISAPAAATDELANTIVAGWTLPTAFYKREYTEIAVPTYGAFDDIVLPLSSNDLIGPLVKDGAFKSAESQWADQVVKINDALVSFMLQPSLPTCAPPPNQTAFNSLLIANNINTIDPWGGAITYSQSITKLSNTGTATPPATVVPYTLTTATAVQTMYVPTIVTLYGKYKEIINNVCPP